MLENISVIVPVYNEEKTLPKVLLEIHTKLIKDFENFEIIIVDDHSFDNSLKLALQFAARPEHKTRVIRLEKNYGSGKAIYTGIKEAKYSMVIYIPADGQFDCQEIKKYAEAGLSSDIVLGIRSDRHDYTLFRKLSSYTFISLFNFLFKCNYKDINWINLWRKEIFNKIQIKSEGVFFLGEIVARSKYMGYKIVEIPSLYLPRKSGKAKGGRLSSIFKAVIEIIRIKIELT